jgi:hypothetical protein
VATSYEEHLAEDVLGADISSPPKLRQDGRRKTVPFFNESDGVHGITVIATK